MSIESAADRQAFMEAFGVPATVSGITITAIWDKPYLEELGIATAVPQIMYVTSDLPDVAYGQSVVVADASFTGTVREIHPDGVGMTILYLAEG